MSQSFGSLQEMITYIESKMEVASNQLANEMVDIMKESTKNEQYSTYTPSQYVRTGKLIDGIQITSSNKDNIEVTWKDMKHKSYSGKKTVYALWALENGSAYADRSKSPSGYRPTTSIVDKSYQEVENKLPKCYKQIMNSLGVPII